MLSDMKVLDVKSKIALGGSGQYEALCSVQIGDAPAVEKHLIFSEKELGDTIKSLKKPTE